MSSQNSYYKLIREKSNVAKNAAIKGLNNSELETTNESISDLSGELIQNVQINFDVCSSLIDDKDKYKE